MRVRWVADTRGQTKQAHAHHTQPTRHLHPHPRLHPHPHPAAALSACFKGTNGGLFSDAGGGETLTTTGEASSPADNAPAARASSATTSNVGSTMAVVTGAASGKAVHPDANNAITAHKTPTATPPIPEPVCWLTAPPVCGFGSYGRLAYLLSQAVRSAYV